MKRLSSHQMACRAPRAATRAAAFFVPIRGNPYLLGRRSGRVRRNERRVSGGRTQVQRERFGHNDEMPPMESVIFPQGGSPSHRKAG
jgi:hypothetical protein